MKLDWLKLAKYKNLVNFEINFDETEATTVVLGRNGTGKSNLLEALVEIFRDLELGIASDFEYDIQYICRDHTVRATTSNHELKSRLSIVVDNQPITLSVFRKSPEDYLPNYVFAYYSGWSSRLEGHFSGPTRRHYDAVLNSSDRALPLRRMFFCRRDYSQLVLLAFFLSTNAEAVTILKDYLSIKSFESSLFVLKRPWWGKPKARSRDDDPRFWNARGAFRGFLNLLWEQGLAPIRQIEQVDRDVRRQPERTERLYLFIKDSKTLHNLASKGENAKDVFGFLESLFLCDLIDEVRVTVNRIDGSRVAFKQLSEGEQQLLTVLGLLLFTQDDESLYLLDEPDTHLNPIWTYDYLGLLQQTISASKGQLVVSTHNPLMIGSLHKAQVRVLARDGEHISAKEPEEDPMGVGIEGLLKSELYGLRSTLAPEVLEKLDRHYLLLGKKEKTSTEQREVMAIANELNELRVSRSHPNPYFDEFANAMAKIAPAPLQTMDKAQLDAQTTLADQVIREIIAEEKEASA